MSKTATYTVTGMTCGHCVASVTEEVQEIAGVEDVEVDLETGALTVTSAEPLDDATVRAAVEEAGYTLAREPRPRGSAASWPGWPSSSPSRCGAGRAGVRREHRGRRRTATGRRVGGDGGHDERARHRRGCPAG